VTRPAESGPSSGGGAAHAGETPPVRGGRGRGRGGRGRGRGGPPNRGG